MTSAFWRGRGPEPGMPIWLDSFHEQVYEHSLKVLSGEPAIFDFGKWKAAVSLRQRLQWMENPYRSPDVLQHAEKDAQAPVTRVPSPGELLQRWHDDNVKTTSWEFATSEEILAQLEWYLRGQFLDPS